MINLQTFVDSIRLVLLLSAWVAALAQIVLPVTFNSFINAGVVGYSVFVALTFSRLRRETILILLILLLVGWILFDQSPTFDQWFAAGRYVLIFTALLPTMALMRATALTMPSILSVQKALTDLPPSASTSGFHLAANVYGSVINTGSLAILSAAIPANSSASRRRLAAESALRGMVTAAAWSPFFIAFAIGQSFTDSANSWIGLSIGVITTILFSLISLPLLNKDLSLSKLKIALACLKPVAIRLTIVFGTVLCAAIAFNFTALSAVVVVVPFLILIQFYRYPKNILSILKQTRQSMIDTSDDILIISMAMLIGYFATQTGAFTEIVVGLYNDTIPGYFAISVTPICMMLASIVGVHPVISSTILLGVFSGGNSEAHPALLMQAHLIGWGAGTMSSVASLSVITCANLFRVPSRQLVLGKNLWVALAYSLIGGLLLAFIDFII